MLLRRSYPSSWFCSSVPCAKPRCRPGRSGSTRGVSEAPAGVFHLRLVGHHRVGLDGGLELADAGSRSSAVHVDLEELGRARVARAGVDRPWNRCQNLDFTSWMRATSRIGSALVPHSATTSRAPTARAGAERAEVELPLVMSSTSKYSGAVTWATLPHSIWRVPMSSVSTSTLPLPIDLISPTTRVPFWTTTTSTLGAARAGPAARSRTPARRRAANPGAAPGGAAADRPGATSRP